MTAYVGRKVTATWGGASIGGVQDKGIKINGKPIDITDTTDAGWQELLTTDLDQYSVEITLSGVTKDNKLMDDWFAGTYERQLILTYPDTSTLTGNFVISALSESAKMKGANTFTATFMSTGTVVWAGAS